MISVGVIGLGEVGKGVLRALEEYSDMAARAVFTNRNTQSVLCESRGVDVYPYAEVSDFKEEIDVMINCGSSADSVLYTTPGIARHFNIVDSYDVHMRAKEHFAETDISSRKGGKVSVICAGWDPGLFSVERLYMSSVMPHSVCRTFWGKGISRGHTNALKGIDGVECAVQYTVPFKDALDAARKGGFFPFSKRQMHKRECYVTPQKGADVGKIEREIKNMPYYFEGYETEVHFISKEEFERNHTGASHAGCVIGNGVTGDNTFQKIEYSVTLGSNSEFTGAVLVCFARAAVRLFESGERGCRFAFDIPPVMLSPLSRDEITERFL